MYASVSYLMTVTGLHVKGYESAHSSWHVSVNKYITHFVFLLHVLVHFICVLSRKFHSILF